MTTTAPEVEGVHIPDTPAGLEEMLQNPAKMKALFAEKGKFADFIRAYAKNVHNQDQAIATQVRDQVQQVLGQWLREQGEAEGVVPVNLGFTNPAEVRDRASARGGLFNQAAMGASIDKEFKSSAEFFKLIWHQ